MESPSEVVTLFVLALSHIVSFNAKLFLSEVISLMPRPCLGCGQTGFGHETKRLCVPLGSVGLGLLCGLP